ncbi:MAG: GerMN domain-containing protein [Spirochaetaceae bacterium]
MRDTKSLSGTQKSLGIVALMLFASFVISVVFYVVLHLDSAERVLFFPGNISDDISGERRIVRNFPDPERDMEVLVEEVMLGPTSLYRSRVFPKGTSIRIFMVRDNVAYLDLSRDALFGDDSLQLEFNEAAAVLRRSLHFNFRSLEDVVITVEGQLPNEPPFTQQNRQNEA